MLLGDTEKQRDNSFLTCHTVDVAVSEIAYTFLIILILNKYNR